ncbi:hypothetical protein P7F88_00910 [Vibrio hannami]|uniref:hypothetical protein n=1 Tax=Vibrio hannami TaxID=2717094 RepID=UPI002410073D|nr:hypothetical protein [Vibrio hannami]MDG3084725.1 hypothetical protein [Vibrio hannami]
MSEIEKCSACNKKYEVSEIGGQMPGSKEPEEISCPYCGNTITRRSNGAFRTHALPEDKQ